MRGAGREIEVAAATLGIEAPRHRDRFQQRRFSSAVFADEERHRLLEIELVEIAYCRDVERVFLKRRNLLAQQARSNQEVARLPGRSASQCWSLSRHRDPGLGERGDFGGRVTGVSQYGGAVGAKGGDMASRLGARRRHAEWRVEREETG